MKHIGTQLVHVKQTERSSCYDTKEVFVNEDKLHITFRGNVLNAATPYLKGAQMFQKNWNSPQNSRRRISDTKQEPFR